MEVRMTLFQRSVDGVATADEGEVVAVLERPLRLRNL
jgi:hypothetical protein